MNMENLNIWCEKCKIPMMFSYRDYNLLYYYICPGCRSEKKAWKDYCGRLYVR